MPNCLSLRIVLVIFGFIPPDLPPPLTMFLTAYYRYIVFKNYCFWHVCVSIYYISILCIYINIHTHICICISEHLSFYQTFYLRYLRQFPYMYACIDVTRYKL